MANNQYVLQLQGVTQATNQVQQLQNTLQTLQNQLANTQQGTQAFQTLTAQIQQTQARLAQANQTMNQLNANRMSGLRSTLSGIGQGFSTIAQQATGAQGGLGLVTQATAALGIQSNLLNGIIQNFGPLAARSFTTAGAGATTFGKVVRLALASTGIGLLIVAVASLTAYFTKSTEGSKKMAVAMAYLSGIFNGLVNALSSVGKWIMDVATDFEGMSKKIKSVGNGIKEYFTQVAESPKKLFDDLVGFFSSKLTLLDKAWDNFKKGNFKEAANSFIELTTGIENGVDKAAEGIRKFGDTVEESVNKSLRVLELEKAYKRVTTAAIAEQAALQGVINKNNAIADSDLRTQQERDAAAKAAIKAQGQLLDSKNKVLRAQLTLLQAENAQVIGGVKTADMLQEEARLRAEIAANTAEKGNLNLALQEKIYKSAKENADREKDTLERTRELNKQALNDKLAEAITQEEKLAILQEIYNEELKFNTAAKANYAQMADTSDKAAQILSIDNDRLAAEKELKAATKATNDEYAKRLDDALVKTSVAELENYKLKAVQAGLDKQYDLQLFYINAAKVAEAKILEEAYQKEKSQKGKTSEELEALHAEYINKKIALDQNYAAQTKGVDDTVAAKKKEDAEKELEALEKKYQTMGAMYEGFSANVQAISQAFTDANVASFDAKLAEVDLMLQSYRENMSQLNSELSETESNINDLESRLLTAKGAEREKIIQQLESEIKKQRQLSQNKKIEDQRIKKAEQDKIKLEQEKEKALARQEIIVQSLTLAQHALNAAKGIEAAIEASKKGFVGWDNIAILAAATAGVIASMSAIKGASRKAKGFKDGGFTSGSISDSTPVGVVHANEYVLPAWMVRSNPVLVTQLESMRTQGQYSQGGMVAQTISAPSAADVAMLNQLQQLNANLDKYSQTPIHVVATEVTETSARVARMKEYAIK